MINCYIAALFLSACCLLCCLQVAPQAHVSVKAVHYHSSTVYWPGNCLAWSIELLSNNLPLLHLYVFSFNRISILYSFNCRLLICFPVNRSEVQTRRRSNSFRTVLLFSCGIFAWHSEVRRCFRSWWVWRPVGQSQLKWVLVVTDPMAVRLGCSFSVCLLCLRLPGGWRDCGWWKWRTK